MGLLTERGGVLWDGDFALLSFDSFTQTAVFVKDLGDEWEIRTDQYGVEAAIEPNAEIEELPAGTKLVPVLLKSDYWAHPYSKDQWPTPPAPGYPGDNRCVAGSVIRLPGKEARRLIDSGAAVRDDPMPDEVD